MNTYRSLMSCSRWLLLVCSLWLPAGLLAQSGPVPTEAGGRTDTVRMGMGVFGNVLGIHGADTLALQGDLVLVAANIVGEGTLSLCARQPQRIMARKSSVQNLHIANPTQVTVKGELTIQKSLVVENGILDGRMATTTLADSCRLRLQAGGQVLWPETQWLVKQATDAPQPRPTYATTWATVGQELMYWKRGCSHAVMQFTQQPVRWLQRETIPPSPPPEPGKTAAFVGGA